LLTARGDIDDRINGLRRGADDYLTKPFDLGEFSHVSKPLPAAPKAQTIISSQATISNSICVVIVC
jgi:DNA-binding response OmpR family regulator